ncbi:hypothetical protein HXX76_002419 [Chlamydomonas incerta]|uniref:Uncharacterized protein n=1 Tax=Chlamydomonas incerta TaxID=51695 RepID=A0A835W8Z7_CHLIN|nr:hypothetical protein HXX76_002419 [Chlamydomonas incerta]|eukprot:KAG2442333.1 hypothetical protein HXX76_002419 [Chlamydomonas incerta]
MEEQPVAVTAAVEMEVEDAGARLAQRHERRQQGRRHVLPPALPRQPLCSWAAAHMARAKAAPPLLDGGGAGAARRLDSNGRGL